MLLIPTAVPRVAIRFGKPDQRWLDTITVDEARAYIQSGEFGAGSMEPKVAAVADFVESTPGAVGIIGAAEEIRAIIEGKSGTRIVPAHSAGTAP
jgi:carbamate kinase